MIVPEHSTQYFCASENSCMVLKVLDYSKIVMYVCIIEFYKGVTQLGADRSLRIQKGSLCMEAPCFKGFPFQVIQHICRPNII